MLWRQGPGWPMAIVAFLVAVLAVPPSSAEAATAKARARPAAKKKTVHKPRAVPLRHAVSTRQRLHQGLNPSAREMRAADSHASGIHSAGFCRSAGAETDNAAASCPLSSRTPAAMQRTPISASSWSSA